MLSSRLPHSRIPLLRPLRPPNLRQAKPQPRPFTQNSQLLLIASHTPRPQLPYLSQPAFRHQIPTHGSNQQLARLLSTENRRYAREQLWLATKWTAIGWTFLVLSGIAWYGFQIETLEREDPTPTEWSWWTRHALRIARAARDDRSGTGIVDWANVGSNYRTALKRLEEGKDAKGVEVREAEAGGEIMIPDVGKVGFDISAKDWPWRSGYFECIMGCAAAAERLDDMVLDTTRSYVFPREVMIGPSNPDPRPVPNYMYAAPLEENCSRPFDPPEKYYMRVLTGLGFTTKQKLDAALAYANWLEFKGLDDSALEMYKWGIDIASEPLPYAQNIINRDTAVLSASHGGPKGEPSSSGAGGAGGMGEEQATPNLLRATTALAIHHARTGNVSAALPILLSVLRARRNAPVSPYQAASYESKAAETDYGAAIETIAKILRPTPFPGPPLSGDESLIRGSERPTCEEAELMLYIGEILFATGGGSGGEGIGWTRQAVTIAEANLTELSRARQKNADGGEKEKCAACLQQGVENWETMLRRLSSSQQSLSARGVTREGGRDAGWLEWKGWFGKDGGVKGASLDELSGGVVEEELKQVARLKDRIAREGIAADMDKHRSAGGGVWIG